jgi:hypothetical protein
MEPADCATFAGHGNTALNKNAGEAFFSKLFSAERARKESTGIFVRLRLHNISARETRLREFHEFLALPAALNIIGLTISIRWN